MRVKLLTFRLLMSYIYIYIYIYMEHPFLMFLDHTQRRSTVGRTPLDEWAARRRDLYLTTHDTHNRQISMPPVGFEPTISAGERPQTARLLRVKLFSVWQFFRIFNYIRSISCNGTRGGAVRWGTVLQTVRSRVRFPMVSLEFFFDVILPVALWPWGWLSL